MTALLALAPIVLTLALLLTRLPAWAAPAAGAALAAVLAVVVFGVDPGALAGALAGGAPTVLEILAIIAGGIALSRVMDRTGAHERLGRWLSAGTGPTLATALLMVHGVIPFLETVTGFGVSLIVGVPLLIGLGYTALRSAVLAVLALTIGPWGSMAPGTLLGSRLCGVDFREMGVLSALFDLPACVVAGVVTVLLLSGARGLRGDAGPAPRGGWLAVGALSGVAQCALIAAANALVGTAPAGALGTAVLTVGWLLIIRRGRLAPGPGRDVVPYAVLLAGTVAGSIAATALGLTGPAALLGSPAVWSLAAVAVGVAVLGLDAAGRRALPAETARLWVGTAVPTALYVAFGLTLSAGGVSDVLAGALAGLGDAYLPLIPVIGAAGGFITASNTGSSALFATLQAGTATSLGVPAVWACGLHNAASGWGIIAGPARIQVAHRMAEGAQRPDMPGWAVSPRTMLAILAPAMLAGIAGMALMGAVLLPRG